jgi:hypothetical protein
VADSCLFCFPKGSSKERMKERQGSSREYTPECHTGTHWYHDWHTLAHTGTHHWHTSLAHTGTINVYRMVIANVLDSLLDARRPCQTVSCRTKSGGLGVRDCCHAPSANAPRHQTWTSIVWMTHQSGCGIKVDRGIKRESIKAMMRCLRF